ncbi:MAG: protein kinase [Verrucomicrobiales bacterium]|nr:protein kinase [Verrucomicrobiales bacterium]
MAVAATADLGPEPFDSLISQPESVPGQAWSDSRDPVESIRLGDYLLEEQLGHGGMGVIYRARQISLDRIVAVKLLLLGRYSSVESLKRFRREAQAAASLRHPNIVSVFEVGETDGQPFLALEYVDGQSLSDVLRQGPVAPLRAAEFARVVAEAIHYAHTQGVLHRDIKPSNVLVDVFGQVRLTDFGLAKKLDGSGDMTVTGELLGSPNYLSPEQAEGRNAEVGPASDVYGVGALLYELLTGRPPFMAQSIQDTLLHIRDTDPVPPTTLNPALPPDLNTIALKCLEKAPAKRYASAHELAEDLSRFLRHEPITARPTPAWERTVKWIRRDRARAALVVTIAGSLIALTAASLWISYRIARARQETEMANRELARNLFVREWNDAEHFVDDGKTTPALTWFARVLRRDPSNHVAATRLLSLLGDLTFSTPAAAPLVHTGAVLTADFSPDGRSLLTASADGQVRRWDWRTEVPPWVLPGTFETPAATYLPETDGILVAERRGVSRWSSEGVLELTRTNLNQGAFRWSVSRDGAKAALISNGQYPQLWDPVTLRRVANQAFDDRRASISAFSADGRYLVAPMGVSRPKMTFVVALVEVSTGRLVWEARIPDSLRSFHVHSVAISDDNTHVAACRWGGQTLVWRVEWPETNGPSPVVAGLPVLELDLGPVTRAECFEFLDHNRLLAFGTTDGTVQLCDLTTGQTMPDRIEHGGMIHAAVAVPDGTTLATASVDGLVRFWDLRPRRPEPVTVLSSNEVWDVAISPDGAWMVMGGGPDAEIRDLATGRLRHSLPMGRLISRVAVTRDGQRVITCTERGLFRMWNAETGEPLMAPLQLAERIHDLSVTADGRWICVGGPSHGIKILDARTGAPALPEAIVGTELVESTITPDGRHLIAGTTHGEVHFWSLPEMTPRPTRARHHGVVWSTRISRDSRRVATTSGDQTTLIWDVASAHVMREIRSDKAVYSSAFSPDGRRILIGSADRTARVWDVETGRQTSEIMRHPGGVWFTQYSPDGRYVATGDDSGVARLWDAESGLPLGNWLRSRASLKRITFSPDGRRLVTTSVDRTARIWPVLVAPGPAPAWVAEVAEAVAGRRLDDEGRLQIVPFEAWRRLQTRFAAEGQPPEDWYEGWGRWFFVDRVSSPATAFHPNQAEGMDFSEETAAVKSWGAQGALNEFE